MSPTKLFSMLPTAFTEHRYFSHRPYSRGHAMADLAVMAAYGEHDISIKGHRVHLRPGDVPLSVRFLATRWGWSKEKVETFIATLVSDGLLLKIRDGKSDGLISVFRIVAPGCYRTESTPESDSKSDSNRTAIRTAIGHSSREVEGRGGEKKPRRRADAGGGAVGLDPHLQQGPAPVGQFFAAWTERFEKAVGERPELNRGKVAGIAKRVTDQVPMERVLPLLDAFFADDFAKQANFSISLFAADLSRWQATGSGAYSGMGADEQRRKDKDARSAGFRDHQHYMDTILRKR